MAFLAAGLAWAQESEKKEEKPAAPAAPAAAAPAAPTAHVYKITPEDVVRKNPVKFTEGSVERGKKRYFTQCAMCHGETGDGKGDLATELKVPPTDFTKPEVQAKRTDGEWYAIIGSGNADMPEQSRLLEKTRWDIVNYLRGLGGKKPAKSDPKEAEENILLVPQEK